MAHERIDGYVRVSRVGDRALRSDQQQRTAIEREARRLGLVLDEIAEDLDQLPPPTPVAAA